jgi:hypothetical protein
MRPVLGRREFLRLLAGMAAWLPAPMLLAAVPGGKPEPPPAFGPYLDTLLPEEGSPSASQLGLDQSIIAGASGDPRLQRLVELGCAWLDQQARRRGAADFAGLEEAERIALVRIAERASGRTLPNAFFAHTIYLAYQEYYTNPAAWESLGFAGPPQPRGFMGHDRAPGETP